ncbi:leucine Rich repeat-containing domain protein [Necator americanus]|uniref:Leucine Rich repeat-containing domain protein n=1 Tax=Necator americanus TaxID=51031 RepID=W2ST80_NECAM|nr:leucine Rich repeat-containing domain protein [Necator americanus]ETN72061.1 leucine Rich repeat-containing domain protein [Necator americanus]
MTEHEDHFGKRKPAPTVTFMRWIIVVFLIEVISAICPPQCICRGDSMSCSSLNEDQLSVLNFHLSSAEWSGLRELSIHETPSLSIDHIPKLNFLEIFDISNNGFNDDVWLHTNAIFPLVRKVILENNNFTSIGMHAFRFIPQLYDVDLSGNLIERFIMSEFSTATSLRYLNMLDLSSSAVRAVEAGSFSRLPRLHSVIFANCRELIFVSPAAFENISIFSLDLSGTGVKTLPLSLLSSVARIRISNVPLDCGCLSEQLTNIATTTITDWSNSTCLTRKGEILSIPSLSPLDLASTEQCRPSVILPFGEEMTANVGQTFKIYCAGK